MTDFRLITGRILACVIALIIIVTDRLTKVMIQHAMNSFDDAPVIPGFLRVTHLENPGAAFGFLAEGNPLLRKFVLIGVALVVICFVFYGLWSSRSAYRSLPSRFGLGLILGGAIGNLYDRIAHGTVTDFIEVFHGSWVFPAFNLADSAITIGGAVLVLEMIWENISSKAEGRTPAVTPAKR